MSPGDPALRQMLRQVLPCSNICPQTGSPRPAAATALVRVDLDVPACPRRPAGTQWQAGERDAVHQIRTMVARRTALLLAAVTLSAGIAGCGVSIPADPDSTLERVSGGILRVGVTANGKWASVREGEEPGGIEPALVRSFASSISAVPEWVTGSEQELTKALKEGELDLVVGGFAADTPWITHAGTTRPYTESKDAFGKTVKHVLLVPLGENGFLFALDRFLLSQDVKA